jgi:protein-S-isoprenylcysteine O-methyltransferase Ste14
MIDNHSHNDEEEGKKSQNHEKEKIYAFLMALLLSALFTVALLYAVWELPRTINMFLRPSFPDPGHIWHVPAEDWLRLQLIGYICFGVTVILILVGYLIKCSKLTISGSVAFYLPIFGHFAGSMFFFAGIGIFRVIWMPFFDISILSVNLLTLGDIVLLPYNVLIVLIADFVSLFYNQMSPEIYRMLTFDLKYEVLTPIILILGIAIFVFSTMSWLYGKFLGEKILHMWIYKYSRHPQYLGLLLWSYGLLTRVGSFNYPKGGYVPPPTFPWLIFACLVIGIALQEELKLLDEFPDAYLAYCQQTAFLLPLPKLITTSITRMNSLLIRKARPAQSKDIILILGVYFCILTLLSFFLLQLSP